MKYTDDYGDFEPGWLILNSHKKDKSDFEWETISFLLKTNYVHIIVYLVSFECLRVSHISEKSLQYFQITFSVMYLFSQMGYLLTWILLIQPITFIIVGALHSKLCIWICNLTFIGLSAVFKKINSDETFLKQYRINHYETYISILILSWMNLRCTSYYLTTSKEDIRKFLAYCLYFPTMCTGPFLSFKHFDGMYCKKFEPIAIRIKNLILNILRCLIWFTFGEICLHYIYVNATGFQPEFVKQFDMWTLCGYGYAMGQFFHLKYIVIYGLSTSIASFENITTPSLPRCIGRIHLYSEMWKYFDPGLYDFLKMCIYIPLRRFHLNKFLSSLLCFSFIFIWHGIAQHIFIWVVANFIGINLESLANIIYESCLKNTEIVKSLGSTKLQILKNLLASPLLAASAVSNFYFFAGVDIGYIFLQSFLTETFFNKMVLLSILYCCCEVSISLRDMKARSL
ncbi:protein-cysteine N-palmitoyltransferase Rasp isoform X2 [Cylas formicarius]|nr:protein-cysteine N-palmitoyltransferase Rasp isoform X2 [Cylas formicarius]